MTDKDWQQDFPEKRLQPVDGMAVTAAVWEEAHGYHRRMARIHNRFGHGPGILVGMEVIASDPPDSSVYILPGLAIDPNGNVIQVREPIAYDLGKAHGPLHLLLTYGESPPRVEKGPEPTVECPFVHSEFALETRSGMGSAGGIELTRIQRSGGEATIANAADSEQPGVDEIDLRFRHEIGASTRRAATMAVLYPGGPPIERHSRGAVALGRAARHEQHAPLWIDDGVPLDAELGGYTIVYIVGRDSFRLKDQQVERLGAYLAAGGTVLFESCRHSLEEEEEPAADASFARLVEGLGIELEALPAGHPLLKTPHLFGAPTPGFARNGEPEIRAGGGVIFSSHDYGCLWQGEREGGAATREEIRAAHEWGENLVAYAQARKRQAAG